MLLAFANLGTDRLKKISLRFRKGFIPRTVQKLGTKGNWLKTAALDDPNAHDKSRANVACSLHVFDWLILKIES